MKTRVPLVLVGILYLVLFAALVGTFEQLPERVASHFGGAGMANGWMTREHYLLFTICLGILLPGFLVALCFALRYLPAWTFNLPNRDYWLAPERRAETNAHFFHHSLWFACLAILFVTGLHLTIVEANTHEPASLSLPLMLATAGGFLIGMLVWILFLLRPFFKPVPPTEARPATASTT